MARKQGGLDSPLSSAFPSVRGESTESNRAVTVTHREYVGVVDRKTDDILSSPQGGQRRSATGKRESVKSVLPK